MEKDYHLVVQAVEELPFSTGKKLLIDFLRGNETESIKKHNLQKLPTYASCAYSEGELADGIHLLLQKGILAQEPLPGNKFAKVIKTTGKPIEEATTKLYTQTKTEISDDEQTLFRQFEFFLGKFDDEQKKAITCNKEKVVCIAGAGSGKTTVLTKRIEFLTQYRTIKPQKILAITFTRKAREEMMRRLAKTPYGSHVHIETFNSFAEKVLKAHNDCIYDKPVSVLNYGDKMRLLGAALKHVNMSIESAVNAYFSPQQQRMKTPDELSRILMSDLFAILDYYKNENEDLKEFHNDPALSWEQKKIAKMIHTMCAFIDEEMKRVGKRDFSDQVRDCVKFFQKHDEHIPQYDHILIDEYQDINALQIQLIDLLAPKNIFAVGDPRQSIFGWRGSRIDFIINFKERYAGAETIYLTNNYRSNQNIVDLFNAQIKSMQLPPLISTSDYKGSVKLVKHASRAEEYYYVTSEIEKEKDKEEIFILARTNRQLKEMAEYLRKENVAHIIRSDEVRNPTMDRTGAVTLATIHAIKGLEAKKVFVIGCDTLSFPCKTSEHPVRDLVAFHDYDHDEEERRLFYVALSRAKHELIMSYASSSHTTFVTEEMKNITYTKTEPKTLKKKSSGNLYDDLRTWRSETAQRLGIPAYMVFPDKTLQDLIEKQPMSVEELGDVHGLAASKIGRFGEQIIDIMHGL